MPDPNISPLWMWLLVGAVIVGCVALTLAIAFVLCGPPVRQYRPDDAERAQRRARKLAGGR
jgi:hypothetical protein